MRGDGEGHPSEANQAETNWSSDTDDARPLAVLTWASVGRAYDGRNQLMVASEARKARGLLFFQRYGFTYLSRTYLDPKLILILILDSSLGGGTMGGIFDFGWSN